MAKRTQRATRVPSNLHTARVRGGRAPRVSTGAAPNPTEQRYRLLFDHNLAGVYRTTVSGKMLDCNESAARILGYASRAELLKHAASDLYCAIQDRTAFLVKLRRARVLTNSELRLRRKDGRPIDIRENVLLLPDEHGKLTIIQGTMIDVTACKQAEAALCESEQRYRVLAADLRGLTQHLQTVREEERARIARELHDELGQALTALNLDLHWLRGRATPGPSPSHGRIDSMCDLVSKTLQAVRRICADLHPTLLDDLGLAAALEWQAREFEARTGIGCHVHLPPGPLDMPGPQATAVFRILQESLTNIARHAHAKQACITLTVRDGSLVLSVKDNGVGIRPRPPSDPPSLGLVGMRERALRWGGSVEISGWRGRGTTVVLRMPVQTSLRELSS